MIKSILYKHWGIKLILTKTNHNSVIHITYYYTIVILIVQKWAPDTV